MSQRTFTSSIFVKLGGQTPGNEDQKAQTFEIDIDPVTHSVTKDRRNAKNSREKVSPPEFVIKPRRQFVNEGQGAKFKASYEGSPSTVLTWSKDGSVLHSGRKNKIYKDERDVYILELNSVSPNDAGIYTCTIHNAAGSATTMAELEVYNKPKKQSPKKIFAAPSVDSPLRDVKVTPGDRKVILECQFSNAVDSNTCWYKDGQPISKDLSTRQYFDGVLSKLTLSTVTEEHTGFYECAASNSGGEVRTCCRVSVMAPGTRSIPPKFINPLFDQVLQEGDQLVLESKVTGYPTPTIRWYKHQQEIKPSRILRTEFDGSVVRLIMDYVEVSDSDSYKCIAENDVGIDQIKAKVTIQREIIKKSDFIQNVNQLPSEVSSGKSWKQSASPIKVPASFEQTSVEQKIKPPKNSPARDLSREPPVFVKELHDISVREDDPVELLVEVKGTSPVEIVWVHNNSEVNENHPHYRLTCDGNIHQLVIPKCRIEDSGEFVCEAYNEYGEIDTFCRLDVNENQIQSKTSTQPEVTESIIHQQNIVRVSTEVREPHRSSLETPPDFILKPHSVIVAEGKSAIFLCRPQGSPRPTVQWLKQGKVIENSEKFQVTHGEDSILEVRNISAMDCGNYTCQLVNSAGKLSTEVELSISGTPQKQKSPKVAFQGTSQNAKSTVEEPTPNRKRSVPPSPKKGGVNRKIEMFEKSDESHVSSKETSTKHSLNVTPKRLPGSHGSHSDSKLQTRGRQMKSEEKTEDFRDVLNRIKPSSEKSVKSRSFGLNQSNTLPKPVSVLKRDKSPVIVSDAVRKFSEPSKTTSNYVRKVSSPASKSVHVGKLSELSKLYKDSETDVKHSDEPLGSPECFNERDKDNKVTSVVTVKERQAVIQGDLKNIIDKKQSMILMEEQADGKKTNDLKHVTNFEHKPKRNFLAEVSQSDTLEMGAVFGQKFETSKNRITPEKQKRTSVFERPVTEPNEFKKMMERKRNSLPSTERSPIGLHSTNSFRDRSTAQRENLSGPVTRTTALNSSSLNEKFDHLKEKPPKPEAKVKRTFPTDIGTNSLDRQSRVKNSGETRRLSRESSPNFRNVLNQIEAISKHDSNERVENKLNVPSKSKIEKPKVSDNAMKSSPSSVLKNKSPVPYKSRVDNVPSSPSNENHVNARGDNLDSYGGTDIPIVETKVERQRIDRVQKWGELSKLYASEPTWESPISSHERKHNGDLDDNKGDVLNSLQNDRSPPLEDNTRKIDNESKNFANQDQKRHENKYQNMNGSHSENEANGSMNENLGQGHAIMMNLKRTKLSEVEELFEDFSRIDREFESMKRNPKYGPFESLDVDDADKKILSKISVLNANFSEENNNSVSEGARNSTKKQTKYSKKFDFEKSPATVEQQDFRHVLKRHVEPHHRQLPKFLHDLEDVRVIEGQPVTLECQVSGIPRPEVAWSMNNKRIKPSKFFRMTYEDNTAKLVIAGAYPEDDGEYVCSATNSLGTARCSCHLYVEECNVPSNDVTDEEGLSDMSSNQPSTYSSYCNTPVRKISYSSTETAPSIPSHEPHPDIISKKIEHRARDIPSVATSLDESNFDEDEFEEETMKKEAPKIHEINPANPVIERGQKLQLQVSFTAEPKPVVRWYRDSFEIIHNNFYTISTTEHFSRLLISQVDGGDSGKYSITVENEVGSDSADTRVTILDVPSPPTKPYATETTLFTIILSWEEPENDGGSPVKSYKVEMCNAEEESWQTVSESCSSTSYCATDLAAHTPFFFRVSAKNKIGYSQPSPSSDVIVTKDNHPQHRLSVDSDDVFSTSCIDIESPISPFLPRAMQEEELPFTPRTVVPVLEKTFEDEYEKIKEVGKGKFGNVYKCHHKEDKSTWAAKIIKCRKKDELSNVKNEISIMNELTHPKLLMLRDAYETPKSMVLVMEYVGGGELFDRVADEDLELTERDCVHFMRQICEGVRYMHEKSIMHLDLKPENILCVRKDSNLIKIIDFGLARRYTAGESLKVMFGTPEFIAPEVVNYEQIGLPTDIWSLGVICYVLLSGLSPFMGDNDGETLSNVTQGDFDFDDEAFDEISGEAKSFIEKCLQKNMKKRFTITQCIEHKWLAHSERNSSKKLRQSLRNLKQFMARRKWQKMGTAIRALGRMATFQKQRGESKSLNDSSVTSDSDIASQSDLIILPSSPSYERVDSKGDNQETSDTTETDEDVFTNKQQKDCEDDGCENCENNNKHLTVKSEHSSPAEITKDMVDCEAVKGDVVRFDIVVEGDPLPEVKWLHGQNIIQGDSRHSFNSGKNGQCSLIIRDICEADEGEYTCRVLNDSGEDSCSAELIVYGSNAF